MPWVFTTKVSHVIFRKMADGRATAFMGLRTVRQESHETVINFVLRIGLLASRAYPDNRAMADCITLLVLKRGIKDYLRPAVARAATLEAAMDIVINRERPHTNRNNRNNNRQQRAVRIEPVNRQGWPDAVVLDEGFVDEN